MPYFPHKTCCPDPVASAAAIPDEANCSWLHQSHHCEIVLYFLHSISILSFYIDVVLALSIEHVSPHVNDRTACCSVILFHNSWKNDRSLKWRHNGRDGVSNRRRLDCLQNRLFRRRSKKTSKMRVTGFCEGNSPVTGEFPAQRDRNAENVLMWLRHHDQVSV